MNYEELYRREREIKEFHQSLKRPGGPGCFRRMAVPKQPRNVRKKAGGLGSLLRSFFQMFY